MNHYLTVQDVLWINHEVTKQVNTFKYAQLEEATNYQYGYGKSVDILGQAATFLAGFLKLRPFAAGNRGTAFVSAMTFLRINGFEITLDPEVVVDWVMDIADKKTDPKEAVRAIAIEAARPVEIKPVIRTDVHEIIARYADGIEALAD
jgi:death-on-curing family protein